MQIVINMSEQDYYNVLQYITLKSNTDFENLMICAVKNGTPLPKGHGDLVDRDAINDKYYFIYDEAMSWSNRPSDKYLGDQLSICLDTAPTIIKADEKESEDDNGV